VVHRGDLDYCGTARILTWIILDKQLNAKRGHKKSTSPAESAIHFVSLVFNGR